MAKIYSGTNQIETSSLVITDQIDITDAECIEYIVVPMNDENSLCNVQLLVSDDDNEYSNVGEPIQITNNDVFSLKYEGNAGYIRLKCEVESGETVLIYQTIIESGS